MPLPRSVRRLARWAALGLKPNQKIRPTSEGQGYFGVWLALLLIGLYQQSNLILLVAGLAAGPIVASVLVSTAMLRRLKIGRRVPAYAFAGEPLGLDYTLENGRRWTAALALVMEDELSPTDRAVPGAVRISPKAIFARVPGGGRGRLRWRGTAPPRGLYRFGSIDLATRSPFGLLERRMTLPAPSELVVYPHVGQLTRRWRLLHRESTETRRGRRHDRSAQQQEYHGLRDYRPGDSPRWIHWRTSARLGVPMVKEFEQQNDQDIAILLDPWLPRSKVTADQREVLEVAIRFVATVCVETCREQGRRLVVGWTGTPPGILQGPASVKLLHQILGQLAVLRPSAEGQLSTLLDALPPAVVRDAQLVVVSTRPVNLQEETERSQRLGGGSSRGLAGRVTVYDASRGDLDDLFQDAVEPGTPSPLEREVNLNEPPRRSAEGRPGFDHGELGAIRREKDL